MAKRKEGPPVDVFSPEERAQVLEAEISALLDAGGFKFMNGVGYLNVVKGKTPCGCAVGAAVQALGGLHPDRGIHEVVVDTGLATSKELHSLEAGYEEPGPTEPPIPAEESRVVVDRDSPFYLLGQRLRARPDAAPSWHRKATQQP